MIQQKRRILLLAMIMVLLVGAISMMSTWFMYKTSIQEQRARLYELVQSQASFARELNFISTELNFAKNENPNTTNFIAHLARAHDRFQNTSNSGEFTVGTKSDDKIKFLIVNGQVVTQEQDPTSNANKESYAVPMKHALAGKTGTIIGIDYKGKKVLAAYTSIVIKGKLIGLVAKINLKKIQEPFFKANFTIFGTGLILTLGALFFFFRLSEPIIRDIENSEKNYRDLVEGVSSLILRINNKGIISFANNFAIEFIGEKKGDLKTVQALQTLSSDTIYQSSSSPLTEILAFFGEGEGPHEKPLILNDGSQKWISWRIKKITAPDNELLELLCVGNDTTAKHMAREALEESELKHRIIFENSPLGVVLFDPDGKIIDCNDKLIEIIGSTRGKIIEFNAAKKTTPKMRQAICKALAGETSIYEDIYTSVTGNKTTYIRAIFKPVHLGKSTTQVIGTMEDISKRIETEKSLAESEERFKGIAKASPVGIIITNIQGNLTYANERTTELTGLNESELAGQGWLNLIEPSDRTLLQLNWYEVDTLTVDNIEFRLNQHNGAQLWILGQIEELKNSEGQMIGYVVTLTDITQMKISESEHKRLTAAIDQAAEIILITDTDGTITYVNPAFQEISGYSRKEAIGQNPKILKSGEQDSDFYAEMWRTIKQGHTWKGRIVNRRKDKSTYTQEATIGPVRNEYGKIINYVCVARDISNQLLVEAQLRQAQKLESIGELAAGIAHEINTPTQYVSTNTQFMEESFGTLSVMLNNCKELIKDIQKNKNHEELLLKAEAALDIHELEYLEEDIPKAIAESVAGLKRIAEIVQSVKQLAHPGEIAKSLHSLNEIVRNAVTVSSNEWKYVADVELDLDENLPLVNCLKGEIGQVVLNIIVNGAHAIESKIGRNLDEKGHILIKTYTEKEKAVLKIYDTGSGMSEHIVERAFDPFFTTKEVGKGTGQGLAIAHNVIVNMHGGTINIETEEGIGTTFIVKLPFEPAI